MKKFFLFFATFLTIIAGVIFAGNKINTREGELLPIGVQSNAPDLKSDIHDLKPLEKRLSTDYEWILFKRVSELKFNDIDMLIYELKDKMETRGSIVDRNYIKKIVYLEEKVRYEKARLAAFEKNQVNWDSFKPGFTEALDAIFKTAKELGSYSETAVAQAGIRMPD